MAVCKLVSDDFVKFFGLKMKYNIEIYVAEPMKSKAEALEGVEPKNVKPSKSVSKSENEINKDYCLTPGCIHSGKLN